MSLRIVPTTLDLANALVKRWHRHHKRSQGHRWSIGIKSDVWFCGAAIMGNPRARMTNKDEVLEVSRCVTDGTKNACSKLYSHAARAAEAMGYLKIQTFILESESGASLVAAGWTLLVDKKGKAILTEGGTWNRPSRNGRRDDQPQEPKKKFYKMLNGFQSKPAVPAPGHVKRAKITTPNHHNTRNK